MNASRLIIGRIPDPDLHQHRYFPRSVCLCSFRVDPWTGRPPAAIPQLVSANLLSLLVLFLGCCGRRRRLVEAQQRVVEIVPTIDRF
jgi:hypothetical protein